MLDRMVVIAAAVFCGFLAYDMLQRERGRKAVTPAQAGDKDAPQEDRSESYYPYRTYVLVEGMNCSKCALRIENALNALPFTWATAELEEKRVLVRTRELFQEELVRQTLENAGYQMTGTMEA